MRDSQGLSRQLVLATAGCLLIAASVLAATPPRAAQSATAVAPAAIALADTPALSLPDAISALDGRVPADVHLELVYRMATARTPDDVRRLAQEVALAEQAAAPVAQLAAPPLPRTGTHRQTLGAGTRPGLTPRFSPSRGIWMPSPDSN